MDITLRSAGNGATDSTPEIHPEAVAYLTHLAREQDRFLASVAEAGALIGGDCGQLGKVAAIQGRMTQEFLDAQRSIIRRRSETEAAVVQINRAAERDAALVYAAARSAAPALPRPGVSSLPRPTGWPTPAPAPRVVQGAARSTPSPVEALPAFADADMASIARLVDGAFEQREPDGDVMRRQLRDVLDSWWRTEQQESKAAVDDATARAAMRVHVARVESADCAIAESVRTEFVSPVYRYEPPRHVAPVMLALDTATHEDLDDVLASLLDDLDDRPRPLTAAPDAAKGATALPAPTAPSLPRIGDQVAPHIPAPHIAAPHVAAAILPPPAAAVSTDSLTDESAAPQEAFDRFWGVLGPRHPGKRDWVFAQVLFPAVAVIAVLALVLAVVG